MIRSISLLTLLAIGCFVAGCTSLNYSTSEETSVPAPTQAVAESKQETSAPPRAAAQTEPVDVTLDWSDLTEMARDHQRRGEFQEAGQRLEQAALLVSNLPATHVRRRVVFGNRARLAEELGRSGEIEESEELAARLFLEAEEEPELAGPALVSLALTVASLRDLADREAAAEAGNASEIPRQVELHRIALVAAQAGRADRKRLAIAAILANEAYLDGETEIARMAADQALSDILALAPTNVAQIMQIRLSSARIAIVERDFETAIEEATRVNQLLEELDASPADRGYGEAILAEALAKSGDTDRAMAIAKGAQARLETESVIEGPRRRAILAAMARVEAALGHAELARSLFDQALEYQDSDNDLDRYLVKELLLERSSQPSED